MDSTPKSIDSMVARDTALEAYRMYYEWVDDVAIDGVIAVDHDDVEMGHTRVGSTASTPEISGHTLWWEGRTRGVLQNANGRHPGGRIEHEIRNLITYGEKGPCRSRSKRRETQVGIRWAKFEDGKIARYLVGSARLR